LFAGERVLAARTEDLADPGLRAVQAAIGARYLLSAGIWIEGVCWGALSLDDGVTARERTEGERQALAAAAQLFGLAVHRRRERRRREAMLVSRDALLAGVAHAAEILTRTPDLLQALVQATRMLGEAAGVDRVNVFRYDHDAQAGFLYAEWARAGVALASQIDPGPYGYAEYAEAWRPLLAGDVYHSSLREKTGANAALNAALNTKTDLFVPVCVEGRFWGVLNFDDCTTERAWTDGEIDVLRTAAAAVAAAVGGRAWSGSACRRPRCERRSWRAATCSSPPRPTPRGHSSTRSTSGRRATGCSRRSARRSTPTGPRSAS
jgi:GAF domain-containing protein